MNITIEMPQKLLKRLEEKARVEEKSLEETILEALLHQIEEDPEAKAEMHIKLCGKYLNEGEELLAKGDYIQAGEKAWGAGAQIIKAVAAKRGEDLRSHGELHKYVAKLRKESGDPDISALWLSATSLHQNFYEAWLPFETVKDAIENVKKFIEKMKKL